MIIGAHLSASKGYVHMLDEAVSIGANTFQFFTRNPRGGKAKELDLNDVALFNEKSRQCNVNIILAHAPYTLNCCSAKPDIRRFAAETFADDLKRMEATPGMLYNFHPGSHVGQGEEEGIRLVAEALNSVLFENMTTTVLLETMAGKGSELGKTFEEINYLISHCDYPEKLGVCLDTCHIHDAGYDLSNFDAILDEFDQVISLDRLLVVHLNDSKNVKGAHKDRHANLGLGEIGFDILNGIAHNERIKDVPKILETPYIDGKAPYKEEIDMLKNQEFRNIE